MVERPPGDDDLGAFFDDIYRRAGRDDSGIPWQHAVSEAMVERWLATFDPASHRRALVVAAGLGDHAAALAERGLDVVAFDRSPAAVAWAEERHPGAGVAWTVADLFDPPAAWSGSFDLVLEVFTIQSIPPADQARAAAMVASFLSPGGLLVIVALLGDGVLPPSGPPWALDPSTLTALQEAGDLAPALVAVGGEDPGPESDARRPLRDLRRPDAAP